MIALVDQCQFVSFRLKIINTQGNGARIEETFAVRISTIAIVGALALAVSGPALAQKSQKKTTAYGALVGTFEQCESQAHALGMPHGQTGHSEYVRECMGKRPGNANNAAK
jgi:hypothetical protein